MAAAVLPPAAPNFSALSLFDSTLVNAGMLLDSMSLDELVCALQSINKLHVRLAEVMVPSASDVQQRLQDAAALNAQLQSRRHENPATSTVSSPSKKIFKPDDSKVSLKVESAAEDEDDCMLLEDESSFGLGGVDLRGFGDADERQLANPGGDIRSILKDTYKILRGSGPHLFDFSKPWDHPSNQNVAQNVIEHARKSSGIDADEETWKTFFATLRDERLRSRRRAKHSYLKASKLSRRQKAFEALLPSLSPDDLEQYRIVLTRDLTSSDEEDDDETLRVRELVWESDRVREIKGKLDDAFMRRFATVKQRAQLTRCVRDPTSRSSRTIPSGTPQWAIQPQFIAS